MKLFTGRFGLSAETTPCIDSAFRVSRPGISGI